MKSCFSVAKLFLIGFFSACSLTGGVSEKDQKKAQVHYELGVSSYVDREYPQAIEQFEEALRFDKNNVQVEMMMGLTLLEIDEVARALKIFERICPSIPNSPECWNNMSAVLLRAGRPLKAIAAAEKALLVLSYPTPELALCNIAKGQIQMNQLAEAQKTLGRARRRSPDNCQVSVLLSAVMLRRGAVNDGLKEAFNAVGQCPLSAESHEWEAYALYKNGSLDKSQLKYQMIVNEFKKGPTADRSREALELMKDRIPLREPAL